MVVKIVVYALSAIVYILLLQYYMNMFQQNSYRPERYLRWLRSNPLPHFRRSSKVKFVFTRRMRRLFAMAAALFIPGCIFSIWAAVLMAVFTPFVLLLANLLCAPLEQSIARWYYRDAQRILREHADLIVIGVTGSFGKTSTKNYLYRILSEKYNVLMTPGNFNTLLGVVRTIREHLEPYHQVLIVEMGAKCRGDIKQICDLVHPEIGIVTAVGEMHLETFGSLENIQKTKFELVEALPANGYAVMNAESRGIASYAGIPAHCTTDSYGIDAHRCSARASGIVYSGEGMSFDFITKGGAEHYQTRLLGENNVLNLCAALLVSEHLGVDAESRKRAVSKIQSVEHRLSISRKGGIIVLDDAYNSNPEGAAMAFSVLRSMSLPDGARRIIITPGFVEMGPAQQRECRKLGELASKSADMLVIVNKINRQAILQGALEGGMSESQIICADTLKEALASIGGYLTPGSAVLYENDLPDMFK